MPKSKFLIAVICVATVLVLDAAKADGPADAFAGTWVMESVKKGDSEPIIFTEKSEPREVQLITGTHLIVARLDPKTMQLTELGHAGRLSGTDKDHTFASKVECGNRQIVGKAFEFSMRIEGDRLIKNFVSIDGQPMEQVLVRFTRVPTGNGTNSATVGQQLIDLKKAKDAGALSEEEFEKEKARLLKRSGN